MKHRDQARRSATPLLVSGIVVTVLAKAALVAAIVAWPPYWVRLLVPVLLVTGVALIAVGVARKRVPVMRR